MAGVVCRACNYLPQYPTRASPIERGKQAPCNRTRSVDPERTQQMGGVHSNRHRILHDGRKYGHGVYRTGPNR